ncbi:MAG: NADH-quinone oxidoreductase subunit M [Methylacidiphilales bacterium]|nr:NADH-quinone oxidoreductase subunit M [Candidatus Methylacidiphilales bacterium]
MNQLNILSLLIWLPIIGGFLLLLKPSAIYSSLLSLITSLVPLCLSFILAISYSGDPIFQFQELYPWISKFNINYHLSVDAISIVLIVLTTLSTTLVIVFIQPSSIHLQQQYYSSFLIMEGLMIGVFSSQDVILFYLFFEAMLIPMYLIIGLWGGQNRIIATLKFFLYTLFGSILFLVAITYMGITTNSFNLATLQKYNFPIQAQFYLFIAFIVAFGIKVPIWPVHTWLPHAHVEAPTGGSVILAAITLKIGGYAILRFLLPITTIATITLLPFIIILSLIAIVYIGLVAYAQQDMKKLIAYSSVAHMGFVTLGISVSVLLIQNGVVTESAIHAMQGALFQMISHGLISAALFFSVGVLYNQLHTRQLIDYGGVVLKLPFFSALFVLFLFANCGLPGTSGFVGEFFVIIATFHYSPVVAIIASSSLVLGAMYSLLMTKSVIFGPVSKNSEKLKSMTWRESVVLIILAFLIIYFGVFPANLNTYMLPSSTALLETIVSHMLYYK